MPGASTSWLRRGLAPPASVGALCESNQGTFNERLLWLLSRALQNAPYKGSLQRLLTKAPYKGSLQRLLAMLPKKFVRLLKRLLINWFPLVAL